MESDKLKKCLKRKHPFPSSGDGVSEGPRSGVVESGLYFDDDAIDTESGVGIQEPGLCSEDSNDNNVFDDEDEEEYDDNDDEVCRDNRKRRRRTKKERKVALTPEEAESKRILANSQERERMDRLNRALFNLRNALPAEFSVCNRRLSKIRTLRLAVRYIRNLSDMLTQHDDVMNQRYPGWPQGDVHQYQYPYHPATPTHLHPHPHLHPGHPVIAVQQQTLFPAPPATLTQQTPWPQVAGHGSAYGDEGYFSFNDSLPSGHVTSSPPAPSFGPSPRLPAVTSRSLPAGQTAGEVLPAAGRFTGPPSQHLASPLLLLPPCGLPAAPSSFSLPATPSYALPGASQTQRPPGTTPTYDSDAPPRHPYQTYPVSRHPDPSFHPLLPSSAHASASPHDGLRSEAAAAGANVPSFLSPPAPVSDRTMVSPGGPSWLSSTPRGGYFTERGCTVIGGGGGGAEVGGRLSRALNDSGIGGESVRGDSSAVSPSCVFTSTPVEQRHRTALSSGCADQSWPPLRPSDVSPL